VAAGSVLWADLRTGPGQSDLCASLPRSYGARRVTTMAEIFRAIQSWLPWAVCFEYDRPETSRLEALTETRRRFRTLPVLVVAEEHSEELAAWALGWCVWDYLVKPLSMRRLCDSLTSIGKAAPPAVAVAAVEPGPRPAFGFAGSLRSGVTGSFPTHNFSARSALSPAVSYVEQNYSGKLRMGTAARLCDLSPFQFSRNFKKENGFTFRDFVVRVRIQRAADLMRRSKTTVTEAAFGVGFNDLSYFARMFRRQLGVSPSHYRSKYVPEQLTLFPAEPSPETAQKTTGTRARNS
jgi:AraC-like DNA-binding protein